MNSNIQATIAKFTVITLILFSFVSFAFLYIQWYVVILVNISVIALLCATMYTSLIAIYGNLCFTAGKSDEARLYFEKAIKKNTKLASAYLNYSVMLVREGDAKKALLHLDKASTLYCSIMIEKNIILTKASCYWILEDIEKSIDLLEGMEKKYEYINSHALTTLAYMYVLKKDYTKALEYTNRAIEDSPESAAAWDNLGQIHYSQGAYAEAKETFSKALSFNENLVDSCYYMGKIYKIEGNMDEAKKYFSKASKCNISPLNTVTEQEIAFEINQLN